MNTAASEPRGPRVTLVISNTRVAGRPADIRVAGTRIVEIAGPAEVPIVATGVRHVDGSGTAALPGLMNAHTHTAMAMLRSYADDLPLMTWLQEKIWPVEARLTEDDVYWGARLGCLEMIRTGTTFFNDMYWHFHGTARAALDSGMRACLASVLIDAAAAPATKTMKEKALRQIQEAAAYGNRITCALGPHAIYTVGAEMLGWVAAKAEELGVMLHMHLSETIGEVEQCIALHGRRPAHYLDGRGILSERCVLAHGVHLDDSEIDVLAERGVAVVHNPTSNLKLASGGPMRYAALRSAGVRVLIGTDGAASNNNLDLFEELKFASLLAKHASGDPTILPAGEAISMATVETACAFCLEAGELASGKLADIILVDLENPFLFPGHELHADLVYSAGGRAVQTVVCDGQVLMEQGVIPDEAEIRAEIRERFQKLARRL